MTNNSRKLSQRLAALVSVSFMALTTQALAQDNTLAIEKGSIVEVVFVDLAHGEEDRFFNDYFAKVEPILADHGGRVVARFDTFDTVEGEITPQHVLLLNWPSVEAFDTAIKDKRAEPLLPLRQQTLRNLHVGLFTVEEDVSVSLKEGVVYEFFAGNPAVPEAPEMLGQFFNSVIPTALEYGRGGLLDLKPVDYAGDNYDRMIAGVATWPSAADFYRFTNTDVFRDGVEKFRNPALAEQEIINTYYFAE